MDNKLLREEIEGLKKQLSELKKREELRDRIEEIILFTYKGEALGDIQYYKNAIIANCRVEMLNDTDDLKRFVTLYYAFFKGIELTLDDYLYLYNRQINPDSKIESIISSIYNESKNNFKLGLKKKYPNHTIEYNDDELKYITSGYAQNDLERLKRLNIFYNSIKKSSPKAQQDICTSLNITSIEELDNSCDIELTVNARNIKTVESVLRKNNKDSMSK